MNKIQDLSLELLEAAADMVKASKTNDVATCASIGDKIVILSAEIKKVMDTYRVSC